MSRPVRPTRVTNEDAMHVLIVEADSTLAAHLGAYLEAQGDEADYAIDGPMALQLCATESYDAIILDWRLPRLGGLEVCRRLRDAQRITTPLLMLTEGDMADDRIAGFEAGTDDCLVKPFSFREMYLRLQAIVRRPRPAASRTLGVGALSLEVDRHRACYRDRAIELTPIAFAMLERLMRAWPGLVTRADFEARIWNGAPPESNAALRGQVHRLRQRLEAVAEQPVIETVPRVGYRLLETT